MNTYRMPDFLIVGTMKSGTTTLAHYLAQNQGIHIPAEELHYFNNESNFSKGPSWYSEQLLKDIEKNNSHPLIGEKTPGYSYLPHCAQRIKDQIPSVKLIWIFRDPVKRAFSNYLHNKKVGHEWRSFPYCVANEKERMLKDPTKGYVERSKYVCQVERFAKLFSLSDMHFILFEDLVSSPLEELNRLSAFLGVSPFEGLKLHQANRTIMPLLPLSLYLARQISGSDSILYKVSDRINYKLARLLPRKLDTVPANLADDLRNFFIPYNQRLAGLTGLDLSSWGTASK